MSFRLNTAICSSCARAIPSKIVVKWKYRCRCGGWFTITAYTPADIKFAQAKVLAKGDLELTEAMLLWPSLFKP